MFVPLGTFRRFALAFAFLALACVATWSAATRTARAHMPAPSAPSVARTPAPSAGLSAIPAARAATNVAVITIHGPIGAYTAASVKRRLDESVKAGADAIVIDLNTPGGEVGAVLSICTSIKQCSVKNIVAWINPAAYSGGAIIALACREIVLADGATLGDAAIIAGIPGLGAMPKLGDTERAKFLAPLIAEIVESARLRGYDEKLVQGIVTLGVELWLVERADRPGEVLFIDRAEYRLLFGSEPTGTSPRLVGVANATRPAVAPASSTTSSSQATPPSGDAPSTSGEAAPTTLPSAPAPTPPSESTATSFSPASPSMDAKLISRVEGNLQTARTRPVLTAADVGKWKLVEHVSDGTGIFTFKADDLFRYRLAVRAGPSAASGTASNTGGTINADEQLKAFFGATSIGRLDQSVWEHIAAFLAHPIVRGILIVVLLIGLFIELTHPGLVLPGAVAAGALLTILAPPLVMGLAAWWTAAAIVGGVGLLALEILVLPGFGFFGVVGLVLLFGGLVGTFIPSQASGPFPNAPGAQGDLLYGITTVFISTGVSIFGMYFISKHFGSLPLVGKLILTSRPADGDEPSSVLTAMGPADGPARVGDVGIAQTPLRPSGRVRVGDAIIDVVAEAGFIESGQSVRIASVSGFRVTVELAAPSRAAGSGGVSGNGGTLAGGTA
ncbi:MAG: NfeD family protein [Phycisphaerales bacterium]